MVYIQGIKMPGTLTDPNGSKSGWQNRLSNQGDRDLKFFDSVLTDLKSAYRVDESDSMPRATRTAAGSRICSERRAEIGLRPSPAAFAPSAAPAGKNLALLKPKPVLHVAGEKAALEKFAWQQQTVNALRKLNECGEGKP